MKNNASANRIKAALSKLMTVDLGKLSQYQIIRVMAAIRELEAALKPGAEYR